MIQANDLNARIIEEFRDNRGRVGGRFKGAPLLLLHTTGARTGAARINPMMYLEEAGTYFVFASKAGADTNPDWYHNLRAHPDTRIEIGDETLEIHASEVLSPQRDTLFRRQAKLYPGFAGYQRKTTRTIPVIALTQRHATT
jgi:deazaflavin-dependent oxidoreductase (nitroreductase family)